MAAETASFKGRAEWTRSFKYCDLELNSWSFLKFGTERLDLHRIDLLRH